MIPRPVRSPKRLWVCHPCNYWVTEKLPRNVCLNYPGDEAEGCDGRVREYRLRPKKQPRRVKP